MEEAGSGKAVTTPVEARVSRPGIVSIVKKHRVIPPVAKMIDHDRLETIEKGLLPIPST